MPDPYYVATGIVLTQNGATVTGPVGTTFKANVKSGDTALYGGYSIAVKSITSNQELVLEGVWPAATVPGATVVFLHTGSGWHQTATINEMTLNLIRLIQAGLPLHASAAGTLAERDNYDTQAPGYIFVQTDVEPWVAYIKQSPGGWSTGVQITPVDNFAVELAEGYADAASAAQTGASEQAAQAAVSKADTVSLLAGYAANFRGALAADPATRPDGSANQAGDWYIRITNAPLGPRYYTGSAWTGAVFSSGGFMPLSAGSANVFTDDHYSAPGKGWRSNSTGGSQIHDNTGGTEFEIFAKADRAVIYKGDGSAAIWTLDNTANTGFFKGQGVWHSGIAGGGGAFDPTLKADLSNPVFTGNPRGPTPTAGDNDTSLATTAFVQAAITALINGSPGALDTLNELAAALGSDANFSATMATALGLRLRVDAAQSFSSGQKTQAYSNLGFSTIIQSLVAAADLAAAQATLGVANRGGGILRLNAGNIELQHYLGTQVNINSTLRTIPTPYPTLAPAALAANDTTYYVYATWTGTTITLSVSATAPVLSSATGHLVMNGDPTKTYLGMVRKTGGVFVDSAAQRFVCSWYNPQERSLAPAASTNGLTRTTDVWAEINSLCRSEFLTHAAFVVEIFGNGTAGTSVTGSYARVQLGIDNDTPILASDVLCGTAFATELSNAAFSRAINLADGYHFTKILGRTQAATGETATFYVNQSGTVWG